MQLDTHIRTRLMHSRGSGTICNTQTLICQTGKRPSFEATQKQRRTLRQNNLVLFTFMCGIRIHVLLHSIVLICCIAPMHSANGPLRPRSLHWDLRISIKKNTVMLIDRQVSTIRLVFQRKLYFELSNRTSTEYYTKV